MRQGTGGRMGRPASRGFTLVEILAAMSLAVLVMLGVAQVFKWASDAVTEAKAISDAYQSGRGAMETLHHDLTRQTGYICIVPTEVEANTRFGTSGLTVKYRFDSLLFPIVGGVDENGTSADPPEVATGAEVAYTLGARVTGTLAKPYQVVVANTDDDARTMVLVRKAFLFSDNPKGYSSKSSALDIRNPVATRDAKGPSSCLALMITDRWCDASWLRFRVTPPPVLPSGNNALYQPYVHVRPTEDSRGFPKYDPDTNLVVCNRVSEFRVEIWDQGEHKWFSPPTSSAQRLYGIWCQNAPNAKNFQQTYMPRLLRVTMVVHPHNDTTLLRQEPYAGDIPDAYPKKYRGMTFRRIFRINGLTQMP